MDHWDFGNLIFGSSDFSKPRLYIWKFSVHILKFAQTHVHLVGDAIQPSHSLSPSYPPALYLSQHQGLFQWISSSHQVAKVLALQLQHQFFQWMFRVDFLYSWLVWSPCSSRDSQESSPAPQFESINSSTPSLLYGPTLTSVHDYINTLPWTVLIFIILGGCVYTHTHTNMWFLNYPTILCWCVNHNSRGLPGSPVLSLCASNAGTRLGN